MYFVFCMLILSPITGAAFINYFIVSFDASKDLPTPLSPSFFNALI
jgi:hypothetical protein